LTSIVRSDAQADEFSNALVLPGGLNASDKLRRNDGPCIFVRALASILGKSRSAISCPSDQNADRLLAVFKGPQDSYVVRVDSTDWKRRSANGSIRKCVVDIAYWSPVASTDDLPAFTLAWLIEDIGESFMPVSKPR